MLAGTAGKMTGPVEVDEAYIGGKRSNMRPERRKRFSGRGAVGKAIIVGAKERETKKIHTKVIPNTKKRTLYGFIYDNVELGSKVYTDEHQSYEGILFAHESVVHSVGEYVRGDGACERHGVVLRADEARVPRHGPQDVAEAS